MFKAGLWNGEVGHGYHRDDDGGEYDTREWIMVDLRIATAARRAGRASDADELVDWVTQQAVLNYDLVPENYDATTGDYSGAVPMVGFGAGAYVTALWERGGVAPIGGDGGDGSAGSASGVAGTLTTPGGGGGCASSHGGGAGVVAFALTALLLRRRRSAI